MAGAALSDLSVVECAQGVAGPFCAKALADFGAEVIKVEPPAGDRSRRAGPFPGDHPHPERSGQFLYLNANKRGITLDLESARGRAILRELLATADVLVIDLPPRDLDRLALGYEQLRAVNPRLIVTAVSPFGQTGPYRDYRATDLTLFHFGGLGRETPYNEVTDLEAQPPVRAGGEQAHYLTGWTAATATMAAVWQRAASGEGQLVDVGGLESVANMLRATVADLSYNLEPQLTRMKQGFPWVLPCKDGYVSFSPFTTDHWWRAFKEMMGNPEWAQNELFDVSATRHQNADVIEPLALEWMRDHTKQEIYEEAMARGIACFPVNTMQEVANSRQFKYRQFLQDVTHPLAGTVTQPGPAIRMHGTPWRVTRPAPQLGEHTEEVLCSTLGYHRDDVLTLARAGVI